MTLPIPDGVAEAGALTAAFDACLGSGFSRITPEQVASLEELAGALAGTALGAAARESVAALAAGELLAHHLAVLAAARSALEGARADALLAVAAEGLVLEEPTLEPAPEPEAETRVRMESARQWLVELALAGLGQLDEGRIAPIAASLPGIQQRPELAGLAVAITGFAGELLDAAPTSALSEPPLRRWSDLWCRCLLATFGLAPRPTSRKVSGRLSVLGADLSHHEHAARLVIHGLLEEGADRRLVRVSLNAWKVEVITGPELVNLLRPLAPELVDALGSPAALDLVDATLWSTGDLVPDGRISGTRSIDPMAIDLSDSILTVPSPVDRHPVQVAVPRLGAPDGVAVDPGRASPHLGLEGAEAANAVLGLLRFDEGWSLQPMLARKGKKLLGPASLIAAAGKVKKPALDTLRERSSRLLRA